MRIITLNPTRRRAFILYGVLIVSVAIITAGAVVHAREEVVQSLSEREARRLIARVAGIELSTDAVRVKEISAQLGSAIVVAEVETAFRFSRDDENRWRVAEIRLGDNRWEDIDLLARALNAEKTARARAELETVATALEAYRRERGSYLPANDHAVLIDHLSPRYLARIIRIDPWHRPYRYEGTRETFRLVSAGADGADNTADDVVVAATTVVR